MLRKVVLTASAAALALGGFVAVAGPATAGKVALGNATGTVTCGITGKVKISPALSDINTLPSTTTAKTKSTTWTTSKDSCTQLKKSDSTTSWRSNCTRERTRRTNGELCPGCANYSGLGQPPFSLFLG